MFGLHIIAHYSEHIRKHELGYCSPLLLLCERKLMILSKDNIQYEYDVLSKSRQSPISLVPAECEVGLHT